MTIELTPEHELIIARVIHSGAYHDAQDVISAALLALAEDLRERGGGLVGQPRGAGLREAEIR